MTRIELLVKLGHFGELVDLVKKTTSRYMTTNIDLTFMFLKAVNKKLREVSDVAVQQELCQFTLDEIVKKLIESAVSKSAFVYSKVVEIGLKILYKTWKATLPRPWTNHSKFRKEVVRVVDLVIEQYPKNENFRAYSIKLQTLAARFFVRDADTFEGTEDHLGKVADLLLEHSYMVHKDRVRIVSAQALATLIPHMATRDT
jgi:hypothetical protein